MREIPFKLVVEPLDTIISVMLKINAHPEQQLLLFNRTELKDKRSDTDKDYTLNDYNVGELATLLLAPSLPPLRRSCLRERF